MDSDTLYEKLIYENEPKAYQLRLVVNEFRDVQYVHIRKYFLTYEGDYQASREGISMEASMHNIFSLLDGLVEICSNEESKEIFNKYLTDKLNATNKDVS
jgi:hypothetical protein